MSPTLDPESVLVEQLDWIDQMCHAICRRNGMDSEEAADFASATHLRLVENDYSILRRFRGESSIRTYLAVVVAMCFRDYRVARWGRWRPSAEAKRLGRVAVRLETLVYRDNCTLSEAGQALRSAGVTSDSDGQLGALLKRLPRRTHRPVEVDSTVIEEVPAATTPATLTDVDETEVARLAASQALGRVLTNLPDEDRTILRLMYWEGLSVADIARALRLDQKRLYRRIARSLHALREPLAAEGVSPAQVREFLSWPTLL
ncbi:MAG: RNA polymerase sigma factor [Gemmatimonadaceae bacterium]